MVVSQAEIAKALNLPKNAELPPEDRPSLDSFPWDGLSAAEYVDYLLEPPDPDELEGFMRTANHLQRPSLNLALEHANRGEVRLTVGYLAQAQAEERVVSAELCGVASAASIARGENSLFFQYLELEERVVGHTAIKASETLSLVCRRAGGFSSFLSHTAKNSELQGHFAEEADEFRSHSAAMITPSRKQGLLQGHFRHSSSFF